MDASLKILIAAEGLFAAQGYDGTSTRDIARVSGANIAMISYYFGSKEALFQALITRRLVALCPKSGIDYTETTWQQMACLVDKHVDFVVENPLLFQIVARELLLPKSLVKDKIKGFWLQYHTIVMQFVAETSERANANLLVTTLFNAPIQLLAMHDATENTVAEMATVLKKDLKKMFFNLLSLDAQVMEMRQPVLLQHDWAI
jgi:AcrR family transcriptional regulator